MRFKIIAAVFLAVIMLLAIPTISVSGDREVQAPKLDYGSYLPVDPPEPLPVDTQYGRVTDRVVDSYLQEKLDDARDGQMMEFIVQFLGEVQAQDLRRLRELDIEIVYRYTALPAVFCNGSKESIEVLSLYQRVFWIEYNMEMVINMQGTTTVINATKVWNSNILNLNGQDQGRIDGTGVTCVVLDTGIDAGHPDLDYLEKTIMNLKSDRGAPPWIEMENSDTGCGHGTHCAGTVAGNGEASGGAKRGVAPGANLIGL